MRATTRIQTALEVKEYFKCFSTFATLGLKQLGFDITPMQLDIAMYMANGPDKRMVMAQRGQAKSTLASLYAVWCLIQDPTYRVLIVSAGEEKASEVANVVYRLIMQWDILEYLRPDTSAGDRSSAMRFDVHYLLKGIDQSPSVAVIGIGGNLPGRRADLLISDDVKSPKNAMTPTQREHLKRLTLEYAAIVTHGDILYLGTPQTKDSIYNSLPARGYEIRVWPGRFPTQEELEKYDGVLAPYITDKLEGSPELQTGGGLDGSRGQPTDPDMFDEDALIEKELDWGPEGFALQYMLDTSLLDAMRQQLRLSDFIVADFDSKVVPERMAWRASPNTLVELPPSFPVHSAKMYRPEIPSKVDWVELPKENRWCFIDPAGSGGDETAWAIGTSVGPYLHVLHVGGLQNGLIDPNVDHLAELFRDYGVTSIRVESNMGHGLFEINLGKALYGRVLPRIIRDGEYAKGKKERRIIDSLVSTLQRHYIVLHKAVFEADEYYNRVYSQDRVDRSLFYQIDNITTDRNSLKHDDRIEAVAGLIRILKHNLSIDEAKAQEKRSLQELEAIISNPLGYTNLPRKRTGTRGKLRTLTG